MKHPATSEFVSFADESYRAAETTRYVFGAVLVKESDLQQAQAVLDQLRTKWQQRSGAKLHWSDEQPKRRELICKTLTQTLTLQLLAVVRETQRSEPLERRRRKALERLTHELEHTRQVRDLIMEARSPKENEKDRHLVDALLSRRVLTSLRIHHKPGPVEPLLWAADAIAGIAATEYHDPQYLQTLGQRLTIIRVAG